MNVPLKKRHNYGKINGSASSLNEPSAKRLHSSYSNCEDSDYDQQSSNMDESLQNGAATLGRILKGSNARPHQYLGIGDEAVPADIHADGKKSTDVSSSSSVIMSSSASKHESSQRNEDETTSSSSDSDSSGSSHSSNEEGSEVLSECDPLTEDALIQHNADYEPMNSAERINFWNVADEFSEIEDDFDDKKYFSKPIRSERLQKRMYKKPAPVASTSSKKAKKDAKSRKTDEKPMSSPKKSREADKPLPKVSPKTVEKAKEVASADEPPLQPVQHIEADPIQKAANQPPAPSQPALHALCHSEPTVVVAKQQLVNNSIVETRPTDHIPSAIKFRISYSKANTTNSPDSFKIPNTPNTSRTTDGCANCSHTKSQLDKTMDSVSSASSEMPVLATENQEEFYKYLGIDTNPPQEKTSPQPETSPTDTLYNHRRSLRVFIQQRQYEFTKTTLEKSPDKPCLKSPSAKSQSSNGESNLHSSKRKTPENGKVMKRDDQSNGGAKSNSISSNIKQRRSYEPSSADTSGVTNTSSNSLKETEHIEGDRAEGTSNQFGESSTAASKSRIVRVPKRKILLPSPMMLTEMFKRYKACFKHGFAMRQQQRQQALKQRPKKRPSNNLQPTNTTNDVQNADAEQSTAKEPISIDDIQPTCEELINTFSPTSITHSNASTDSAIVVNPHINGMVGQPKITLTTSNSLQWHQDQVNHIDKSQFRNPLDPKHGAVLAILTHPTSPNNDDVIVVIQESQISYWYSTSKTLSMFGVARSWIQIAETTRINEDKEVNALYQHRLINVGEPFPVYVEMRAKESPADELRQCNLTFVYLNVYYVKPNDEGQLRIVNERVNLDTLKGSADSIYYTALKTSPSVLMTWTEHNVNNQTRCGIVKYTLKSTSLDNIEDIFDYSFLQHDIKTLFAINDYHVVGCGDRSISMWDHRNGNLLIDIEIELATIGQNIGCYTVGDDVPEYMLLIQLASVQNVDDCDTQLKVMAVQTVSPYNWRTLQTHNIPNNYGTVRTIFNNDDMLLITFSSGVMLFLNISSPHKIYVRNRFEPDEQNKASTQLNGVIQTKPNRQIKSDQTFAQCNGQIIGISGDRIATKSTWEYFIE